MTTASLGLRRVPALDWRRPELGAAVVAALAWAALPLLPAHHAAAPAMAGHMHHHVAAATPSLAATVVAGLPAWALMSAAMMLPGALPAVRHVAVNSFRWRRQRAVATFVAAYLAVWVAFGVPALALFAHPAPWALAVVLGLAAAYQLTPVKTRCARACHRTVPLPPRGWRAARGCAAFGLRHGVACLGSCWLTMASMAAATSAHLLWMALLTAAVSAEKLLRRPRRTRRLVAAGLAVAAATAFVL
jgi:predicted metal-binding membrane protein